MDKTEYDSSFFQRVHPIKLNESLRIKLNAESWGLLTDYYLESVKINRYRSGAVTSSAIIKVGDISGQVVLVIRGPMVGLLFGKSSKEWKDIEKLCECGQQLFYRFFKNGISKCLSYEHKLFYNFCLTSMTVDPLVVVFRRSENQRARDKTNALLNVLYLKKCNISIFDLYISYLRENVKCVGSDK